MFPSTISIVFSMTCGVIGTGIGCRGGMVLKEVFKVATPERGVGVAGSFVGMVFGCYVGKRISDKVN